METNAVFSLKGLSFGEESSREEGKTTSNNCCMYNTVSMPHPIHTCIVNHTLERAVGMNFILPLNAGMLLKVVGQASSLPSPPGGVDD